MTKRNVTDEQYGQVSKRAHELVLRVYNGGARFETAMDGLKFLIEGKEVVPIDRGKVEDWLHKIIAKENRCHFDFFGTHFTLTHFWDTLQKYGRQQIARWAKLGLEPHYLPVMSMLQNETFPGWKIKPEQWFYKQIAADKIKRNINGELKIDIRADCLVGITVLIDTRLKPHYNNGKQMYKDDNLLGPIIKNLRKQGKIAKYENGPASSRFGVSSIEWEEHIKPALAEKLGLKTSQLRLERAIEANIIPQLYPHMPRKDDGNTNTWVWYEEYFGGRDGRLLGGRSVGGGLADVYGSWSGHHWSYGSPRPLVVL